MPKLHTVYDFRNAAIIPAEAYLLLIFTTLGLLLFFYTKNYGAPGFIRSKSKYWGLAVGLFSLLIFLGIAATRFRDYYEVKSMFDQKQYSIIEGKVQDYHPMPASGHDTERFRVDSLYFEFSDFDWSKFGYNNAASHGGAIRPNQYVQIVYPTYGRITILILKTE